MRVVRKLSSIKILVPAKSVSGGFVHVQLKKVCPGAPAVRFVTFPGGVISFTFHVHSFIDVPLSLVAETLTMLVPVTALVLV